MDHGTLALIWFVLLGALLVGYAVLDGFDMGVGITYLFVPRGDHERRLALNSIGPLWDGNEVWLVTFGGALFAAFPEAYATVFSGFYTAFMLLLFALIFRAVAIEFRGKRPGRAWRGFWDTSFCVASTLMALLFGVAVGNLMLGVPLDERGDMSGGLLPLLNPFGLGVGVMVVLLFATHGSLYLHLKTDGELGARSLTATWRCFWLFLLAYLGVSVSAVVAVPRATANLVATPALWLVPVVSFAALANVARSLRAGRPMHAFASSCATIAGLVMLLGAALYPNLVNSHPHPEWSLTIENAASSQRTLGIMLWIAVIGMPMVLSYTWIAYRTFGGKVTLDETSY